jgi:hypothetical protein
MEEYSDSDTSSESEGDPDGDPTIEPEVDLHEEVEPEPSAPNHDDEYETFWTPADQLNAQINAACLQELHTKIKAQATLPDPTYQKLPRVWPARPFDVRILPDSVQNPIDYFELLWTSEVWTTLVENTNAYAQFKEARSKETRNKTTRWWKPVDLYKMCIFIAYWFLLASRTIRILKAIGLTLRVRTIQ